MKTPIVIILLLLLLTSIFFADGYIINHLVQSTTTALNQLQSDLWSQSDGSSAITQVTRAWGKSQPWLLALTNHKDVDNIALSILMIKHYLDDEDNISALREIEIARFLLEDMPKKERFSLVNIF